MNQHHDTQGVTGSSPVRPTSVRLKRSLIAAPHRSQLCFIPRAWSHLPLTKSKGRWRLSRQATPETVSTRNSRIFTFHWWAARVSIPVPWD